MGGSAWAANGKSFAGQLLGAIKLPFLSSLSAKKSAVSMSPVGQKALGEFWSLMGRRLVSLPELPGAAPTLEEVMDWLQTPVQPDANAGDPAAAPAGEAGAAQGGQKQAPAGERKADGKAAEQRPADKAAGQAVEKATEKAAERATGPRPRGAAQRGRHDRERINTARAELQRALRQSQPRGPHSAGNEGPIVRAAQVG